MRKSTLYLFMVGMLVFGTANTIVMKLADMTKARGNTFTHPYFQAAIMFSGEVLCLALYGASLCWGKRRPEDSTQSLLLENQKFGKKVLAIPAFFDFCGSTLMFLGLALSAPSIYQMIRGSIIIVVAVYSRIFLGRRLYRHQVAGVVLTVIGVTVVGVASVFHEASSARSPLLGVVLLLIAQLFTGGQFVIEEKFLSDSKMHPLQVVGIEGLSGLCYYIVILPVLNWIPCDDEDFCSDGYVEDSVEAFRQIEASRLILLLCVLTMFSIALFNWTGVSTTKYASALARSIVDTSRTILVWLVSFLVGWEDFVWLQLVGFVVLVVGSLLYNEILVLPFWGFSEAVARRMRCTQKSDLS